MEKLLNHKTIEEEVIVEQEISKSKFLTYLAPIASEDEAKEYLREVKRLHPKATHHCSAYVVGDIERSNDDGEPASSAGLPMLQTLRGNELDGVIAVVVRYYGGIKLGVGGLIRAYSSSVTQAIDHATILVPLLMSRVKLTFPYEHINAVETLCEGVSEIVDREYDDLVHYTIRIQNLEDIDDLSDFTQGSATQELLAQNVEYIKEG